MVQDLCYFLNECGAKISGIGTTTLLIEGVTTLTPPAVYYPIPDPVDAMAWVSLAVTTSSPLTITQCPVDFLELELEYLSMMGQKIVRSKPYQSKNGHFELIDVTLPVSKLHANHDKLHPRPYPGLNIDAIPLFMPILTRAKGRTLVHDWIYENRALYALDLQTLGAKVTLLDPHRVWIEGETQLRGGELVCPPALRPGMALLIAMLSAKGESTLRNAYMIERGYGDVAKRLKTLGADIRRVTQS
jgi:UDP-N-acetylglucosamine 1-carboxyvinyltransferase